MLTIDLRGRTALVIGGSRGIGGATTETLAEAGAEVIFTYSDACHGKGEADKLLTRIEQKRGQATGVLLDACDASGTTALVDRTIQRCAKVDILVSNVGQNAARAVENVTDAEWRRFLDINLTSAFNCVRAVLPYMVKAGYGRIVLIGSAVIFAGGGGAIDYAAAKAALTGMMTYLAKEYTRKGILTNIVHPCLVDTDLLRRRYPSESDRAELISQVPVGRLGTPEDIARIVAFLASPFGDYICAQSILADGGRTFFR